PIIAGATPIGFDLEPDDEIVVKAGEPIQDALNKAAGKGQWVMLDTGIHKIPASLRIPSGVTLSGKGIRTILFLDPASASRDALVNADDNLHNVTITELVFEYSNKTDPGTDPNSSRSYRGGYNRGGINFRARQEGQMKNIKLLNVTVR